jgi:hypothetical protein
MSARSLKIRGFVLRSASDKTMTGFGAYQGAIVGDADLEP